MSLPLVVARITEIEGMIGGSPRWPLGADAPATGTGSEDALAQAVDGRSAGSSSVAPGSTGAGYVGGHRFVDVLDAASLANLNGSNGSAVAAQASAVSGSGASAIVRPSSAYSFTSPLPGATLTQSFGPTSFSLEPPLKYQGTSYAHFHAGIDLAMPLGTPVLAAASGKVIAAGRATDGAVIVRIRHFDGSETLYGHLQPDLSVTNGEIVGAGQQIGTVGMTGNTTGPHLHFALYGTDGVPIDPQASLDRGRLPGAVAATSASTAPASASASASASGSPAQLAAPAPSGDPGSMVWEPAAAALAKFDAAASQIPYASQIRSAAVSAGIDPLLLASVVKAESAFQPNVVSRVGAMGLCQLMPATARYLGVTDPFDPGQNLNGGAQYLAAQLKRFGRVDLALAAYQAGPSVVARVGGVPDYASTKAYIRTIAQSWNTYAEPTS